MKKIVVNSDFKKIIIDFDEVAYITSLRKRALIVKLDGEKKRINNLLGELNVKLESMGFIRCHKSFIVNVEYIESFNKSICTLKNGSLIPLGRKYYKEFKKIMYNM